MKIQRVVDISTGEVLDPRTSPDYYTLDVIRHAEVWTPENIRAEYTRLRKIAEERLKTMSKSPIGRASMTYRRNKGRFLPASQLTTGHQKVMLAEVARMITARTGTLSGIKRARRMAIKTFQEHGYEFVTEKTYEEFGEFMRYWKASEYRGYGSLIAVEFFESAVRIRQEVTGEEFDRATVRTNKKDLVEYQFNKWRKQVAEDVKAGRKPSNIQGVGGFDLLRDWEDWLQS